MATESEPWKPPDEYIMPPAPWPCPEKRTVRDLLGPSFPRIVCLCGVDSGEVAEREALAGRIVLSRTRQLKLPTHDTDERLDNLLLHMIDLADEVLVLNVGGAVSFKTGNALAYALAMKKPVRTLEYLDLEAWLAERMRHMNATAMRNLE